MRPKGLLLLFKNNLVLLFAQGSLQPSEEKHLKQNK